LAGGIPKQLDKLKNLKWVYLGYNNFCGEIPQEIGGLILFNHLDLVYNNLTGGIPSSFGNLTNLQYFFLYRNRLTGQILDSIFKPRQFGVAQFERQLFEGEIAGVIEGGRRRIASQDQIEAASWMDFRF
ncbi:Leucine-rich repeat receptor-like serine/threonine-protein kinase SKM1, partial [Linum perenne]